MAKRHAAQALAEWYENQLAQRGGHPYPESYERNTRLIKNNVVVPVKMLNELLREHNEIKNRAEFRKRVMNDNPFISNIDAERAQELLDEGREEALEYKNQQRNEE